MNWIAAADYEDVRYEKSEDGQIAKITIDRPEVRNAFRPQTVKELLAAFELAHEDSGVGVVILTGEGEHAFCSGGDQKVRGEGGYVGQDGVPRLNVLDLQKKIRSLPKPVVAMVAGYAIGGGHVLHVVCDLTIAAENARFGQTGPKVGSFDGGLGASYLARIVGQKKAREIWFLCRQYNAQEALEMGLVNAVVPLEELEATTVEWSREMLMHSPLALRCLKSALNADCDGQMGLLDFAGNATLLYYLTEEAKEGKQAFLEKRPPDFSKFRGFRKFLDVTPAPRMLLKNYLLAARPKTLPAAIVPVWVGCALGWEANGQVDWELALFTLLGAVCIQIATNLFNDAVDAEKGADTEVRLGPQRVTASGLLSRRAVYLGAGLFLVLACLSSIPLIQARGWVIVAIGVPSLYLSFGYTGGPFPLAYRGLGELFVILFFGLVAVGGTYFVQTGEWGWEALVLGLQVGLLSAVLIAINNLRDVDEDRGSGKHTLAVRWGPRVVENLVVAMIVTAWALTTLGPWMGATWFVVLSVPWFVVGLSLGRSVKRSDPGPVYNFYLALAALELILFAAAFTVAVAIA